MPDQNTRFLLPDYHVRGQIIKLDKAFQSVLANANYAVPVAKVLGQALAAVSALGSIIKLRGSIIMQTQGDGAIKTLVAQANNAGEIRGLAHGTKNIKDDLGFKAMLGKGRMVMTIDGEGAKRYQGIIELQGEQLSETLEAYFEQSEQLQTYIHLASNGQQAACFLCQQLPSDAQDALNHWQHVKALSHTLSDDELLELSEQDILHRLFHKEDVQVFEPKALVFNCRCSREKVVPAIIQMGWGEAMALVDEQGEIRADCEFCNQAHRFDKVDVAGLFKQAKLAEQDASRAH